MADAFPGVTIGLLPSMHRFLLRGGEEAVSACAVVLGVRPSSVPCRAAVAGSRAALWLGPDEWLLLLPDGDAASVSLSGSVAPDAGVVIDVSHRQVALEIVGPDAADTLNGGCPLDLHASAFPVGMCTRTVLGKAEIVLWRTHADRFHVEVWRSFAAYAVGLLEASR
jgi:sarcosine oxidase subunit gamma